MSESFQGVNAGFVPFDYIMPKDETALRIRLREYLNDFAQAVNIKENALYTSIETVTGQLFIPIFSNQTASNVNYRPVFRTVIDFGELPNATSKSVAHNIPVTATYSVTRMYGAATDPTATFEWIPLPFAAITDNENIELTADGTNITVTTGTDRTNFTRSQVVLEYIKVV